VIWLQRHPLIYPIFLPIPSPLGRGVGVRAISVPFARENLHLVISLDETQPLYLRYSVVCP